MRVLTLFVAIVLVLVSVMAVLVAAKAAKKNVHIPDHIGAILDHASDNHMRYFPDFKYEGFAHKHEAQPQANLARAGTGSHDVRASNVTQNPHMANNSKPYPDNVMWLLNIFESGYGIPRSYNDILPNGQIYWATQTYLSVGAFDENGNHTPLDSMIGIQERTLTRFGLNLYDAAVWQIALSLWGLHQVAYIYESNILYQGTTGAGQKSQGYPGGITNIRADEVDYLYGPQKVAGSALKTITYPANSTHFHAKSGQPDAKPSTTGAGAFFYRMIGPQYTMTDPMMGPYGAAWKFPWPDDDTTTKWNVYGIIHFNDWKPITGENVWGTMLGPLQSAGLAYNNNMTAGICGSQFVFPREQCDWSTYAKTPGSVQLGITIIPALLALQDVTGTLFHCPWGSKIFPPDPEEGENVSNENNFSGFASIDALFQVLTNYTKNSQSQQLQWALMAITKLRTGLDKWFDNPAILSPKGQLPNSMQVVPQGGHVNSSGYFPVNLDVLGGLAVDCQTWGMTVMGQPRMDKNWGYGTAYNIWQDVKYWAGYYVNGSIAGVGYTDALGKNGSMPVHDIWSAEWTFGAINMAQTLSMQYAAAGDSAKATSLLADAQSMYNAVTEYWPKGLRFPDGSYVYANKRFFIPWGWFSNPISALCSTAWSVLQAQNFDPFHWGGGNKPALKVPPALQPTH